jgi:hypothetical protein
MRRLRIALGLIAVCAGPACAGEWNVVAKGFEVNGLWKPEATLTVSFMGSDLDHDGAIVTSELTDIFIGGVSYLKGCPGPSPDPSVRLYCSANLEYKPGSLSLTAQRGLSDGLFYWGTSLHWGTSFMDGQFGPPPLDFRGVDMRWTLYTSVAYSAPAPPVPEPGSSALWLAGLLGVMGIAARARRRGPWAKGPAFDVFHHDSCAGDSLCALASMRRMRPSPR